MNDFIESADSRETSKEIMEAILYISAGDAEMAVRVWEAPTNTEITAIWAIVTDHGAKAATNFFWGEEGNRWARNVKHPRLAS